MSHSEACSDYSHPPIALLKIYSIQDNILFSNLLIHIFVFQQMASYTFPNSLEVIKQ